MISFGLRLGAVNEGISGLDHLGASVAAHIARGSNDVIRLVPSPLSTVPLALDPEESVRPLRLHQALAQALGNTTSLPVRDLGLLFAHSYGPAPEIFGLMFDLGFRTPEDQAIELFTQVPRQGCVVFLDAIRKARPGAAAFDDQLKFTSVHEVGHIFNLIHQAHPLTFMATSKADSPHDAGAFMFGLTQTKWLARCGTDSDVTPGGAPFRDMGFHDGRRRDPIASEHLTLEVSPSSEEFWPIEPVMLNIKLRVPERASTTRIPAEIDPGHRRFRVLIEDPNGQVRLYRSPMRFCSQGAALEVTADRPFVRDLPLFGQAGGYTFTTDGEHRIWAEFDVTERKLVRSNVCKVNVLPPQRRKPKWAGIGSPRQAQALFYRSGAVADLLSLAELAKSAPRATNAMTRFVCARAAAPLVQGNAPLARWVRDQLKRCLDMGALPPHQESRAVETLTIVSGAK